MIVQQQITPYYVQSEIIKPKKEKNIYWNYHCTEAKIEWSDEDTVIINGIELNVTNDTYDYRNH